jgi:glycerol-3-phosphate dehydrogenase
MAQERPVLVMGGGINGAAIARELVLQGVPVYVVDQADIAGGATAYSSRLIHGGLRYLEYADVGLVRESLTERERLLQLAPQFVQPLRFFIPVRYRASGLCGSTAKFLRSRLATRLAPAPRGKWLVRAGLWLYDLLARNSDLPRHTVHRVAEPGTPPVCSRKYRWLCAYHDAQMLYPERFVVALLRDAKQSADRQGIAFQVLTYHHVVRDRDVVRLEPVAAADGLRSRESVVECTPSAIVNATGCWVDHSLRTLGVTSPQLIGGTKGSHFLTLHRGLHEALGSHAVYAEAADGRPVFLLPMGPYCLVGTTDLPFRGDPSRAVAEVSELEYLVAAVRDVFPQLDLSSSDIAFHYSGVRPLPFSRAANPASVTRRHVLCEHPQVSLPLISVIGGKLTTCRQLAEETATIVLRRLGRVAGGNSRARIIPGAEDYPATDGERDARVRQVADQTGFTRRQVAAIWPLCGSLAETLLAPDESLAAGTGSITWESLPSTDLPIRFVRRIIREEWCRSLPDLVERRLMLLYDPGFTETGLNALGHLLVDEGVLDGSDQGAAVAACLRRLRTHYGRWLFPPSK